MLSNEYRIALFGNKMNERSGAMTLIAFIMCHVPPTDSSVWIKFDYNLLCDFICHISRMAKAINPEKCRRH